MTNDRALAAKTRLMRNFGFSGYDEIPCIGTNGKLSEASAAMGLASLDCLHEPLPRNTSGALRARLEQYDDMPRHCEVSCLLHGDLGPGHTFVHPSKERVVRIIDFTERKWGIQPRI